MPLSTPATRRGRILIGIVLAATACAGCSASATAAGADTYTIGLIASKTGTASQLGVGELQGAQLAVDQLNARGGVDGHHLALDAVDDQSNPEQAVLAARRMISGTAAIVGPSLAGPCNAVIPLASSAGMVDYCLSPGIQPAAGSTTWSASAGTDTLLQRLLSYWHEQGITRIGLLYTTDASGVDGARAAHAALGTVRGMTLTGSAGYDPDAVSVTPQLQAATAGNPQALIVWASGAAAGVAFKGLAQLGSTVPVATTDANLTFAFVKRIAGYAPKTLLIPATRDFWAAQAATDQATAQQEVAYHNGYQQRFDQQPDFGPGVAYDAVLLVARAIGQAHGNVADVAAELQRMHGVSGVVGTYNFSPADHRGLGLADVAVVRATANGFSYVGR
jgi:branched-chain amino acid transport system substrate-binding protein